MTTERLQSMCHSEWNVLGRVPLTSWLTEKCTNEQKQRLHTLGNIVLPRCSQVALHVFASQFQ